MTAAEDGTDAEERPAGEFDFDLLILDIMMPGKSGLTSAARSVPCSTVPIIMLTAKDAEVDKVAGLRSGPMTM